MEPERVQALRDTKALYDEGILDEAEYKAKKKELLAAPPAKALDDCAFVAPNLHLHWYPLARDASYYCFSIFVLITFIYDKRVDWWEALVLLLLPCELGARVLRRRGGLCLEDLVAQDGRLVGELRVRRGRRVPHLHEELRVDAAEWMAGT